MILTEKQQKYQYYHLVLVLSALSINKYEYLTVKEILLSDQSRIIEQAGFTNRNKEKQKKRNNQRTRGKTR